jgi:hypothetical protein
VIKDNFDYCQHLGYVKRIYGILPGVGMVKGFCSTLLIGELVEVLNSLVNEPEEWSPA